MFRNIIRLLFIFSYALMFAGTSPIVQYAIFGPTSCPLYSPWTADPTFLQIHENLVIKNNYSILGQPVRYFQYILSRNALAVNGGDFIECGIQHGRSFEVLATVLDRWDSQNRKIYGFDSFEGLDSPTVEDSDPASGKQFFSAGSVRGFDKEVLEGLFAYHLCDVELIKGWVPESFRGYEDKRFCFAHIDVDLYRAVLGALAFIYPRMLKGGIILFDDYGYVHLPGARKAVDEYLSDKSEPLIVLPTGQAFIIKQ